MVDAQWGMIDVSPPIDWPRITLLVLGMLACAHRCAHSVRHVSDSADSVGELKVVHRQHEIAIGRNGHQANPATSLQLSSNA